LTHQLGKDTFIVLVQLIVVDARLPLSTTGSYLDCINQQKANSFNAFSAGVVPFCGGSRSVSANQFNQFDVSTTMELANLTKFLRVKQKFDCKYRVQKT